MKVYEEILAKGLRPGKMFEIAFLEHNQVIPKDILVNLINEIKIKIIENAGTIYEKVVRNPVIIEREEYEKAREILNNNEINIDENDFNQEMISEQNKKRKELIIYKFFREIENFINESKGKENFFQNRIKDLAEQRKGKTIKEQMEVMKKIAWYIKGNGVNYLANKNLEENKKKGFEDDLDRVELGEIIWKSD